MGETANEERRATRIDDADFERYSSMMGEFAEKYGLKGSFRVDAETGGIVTVEGIVAPTRSSQEDRISSYMAEGDRMRTQARLRASQARQAAKDNIADSMGRFERSGARRLTTPADGPEAVGDLIDSAVKRAATKDMPGRLGVQNDPGIAMHDDGEDDIIEAAHGRGNRHARRKAKRKADEEEAIEKSRLERENEELKERLEAAEAAAKKKGGNGKAKVAKRKSKAEKPKGAQS